MATFVANRWGHVCLLLLVLGLAVALVPSQTLLAQDQNQHVVRTGDTLYSIAARYGTTVDAIVALNGLSSETYIHVGQVLRIPGGSGASGASASGGAGCSATHVVQAGENLLAIALWYEVSMEAIVSANGIANANQIGIGQQLCIPSGRSGVVQAPVSTPAPTGPSQATTHTVSAGENLFRIALRYGVPTGLLMAIPGISCTLPEGAFYVFPRVSGCFGPQWQGKTIASAMDLSLYLLEEAKVALVAGEGFGSAEHVRISYATSMQNLEQGLNQLEAALQRLSGA